MLEIPANLMTGPGFVYPTLIYDETDVILIDTGFPRQVEIFRDAFAKAGVPLERLNNIIITHSDTDHCGGLSGLINALPGKITVIAHNNEKPYIEAELPPLRLEQMEQQTKALTGELAKQMTALGESLKANYKKLGAHVDKTAEDGETLPYCGGITVVFTPGHTPGHISLYHKSSKTLIAGDMFNAEDGKLVTAPVFTMFNKGDYKNSLEKLTHYDIDRVICYHGGLYDGDCNKRILELKQTEI